MNDRTLEKLPDDAQKLVATLPADKLRSLFYLFAGKPDSRIKVFDKALFIDSNDLIELNECVTRKLRGHHIEAQITSVKVVYLGEESHEFGTWAEFQAHHWQEPACIEEIVLKWDFMVDIKEYAVPQRHTLLFRVSSDVKTSQVIQMITSGNSDEFEQMDIMSSPAFCRVDFINAQISKELINEVSDWYKGRREPVLIPETYYWFKKHRTCVADFVHHIFPLTASVIFISAFLWAKANLFSGSVPIEYAVIWVFSALYLLSPIRALFAHKAAAKIYKILAGLEGSKVVFDFTSGDKKKNSEMQNENKKQGRKFVKSVLLNVALNVIGSLLAAWLITNS